MLIAYFPVLRMAFGTTQISTFRKILLLMLFIAIGMAILLPDTALYNFISGTFFLGLLVLLINFISYQWIAYRSKLLEAYLLAVFLFFHCLYS